mmetsp:Transcript_55838/g.181001  ORF Transcript_55838/g.181001 Transcript_55838/m.181001 type:complete len:213 (+) Transcript_55838:482-1120(+)
MCDFLQAFVAKQLHAAVAVGLVEVRERGLSVLVTPQVGWCTPGFLLAEVATPALASPSALGARSPAVAAPAPDTPNERHQPSSARLAKSSRRRSEARAVASQQRKEARVRSLAKRAATLGAAQRLIRARARQARREVSRSRREVTRASQEAATASWRCSRPVDDQRPNHLRDRSTRTSRYKRQSLCHRALPSAAFLLQALKHIRDHFSNATW